MAQALVFRSTPIEAYDVAGKSVLVKRDDLCAGPPFPPLAKVRGLSVYLSRLSRSGVKRVGVFESAVSSVGVALATVGRFFPELESYVFFARTPRRPFSRSAEAAERAGARLIPLRNNVLNVCYAQAAAIMKDLGGVLIPFGFEFPEALEALEQEAASVEGPAAAGGSLVVSAGSGVTICGILNGTRWRPARSYAVSSGRSASAIRSCIRRNLRRADVTIDVIEPRWRYSEAPDTIAPFPCDAYYDRKAWAFVEDRIDSLEEPILFWNVGG